MIFSPLIYAVDRLPRFLLLKASAKVMGSVSEVKARFGLG